MHDSREEPTPEPRRSLASIEDDVTVIERWVPPPVDIDIIWTNIRQHGWYEYPFVVEWESDLESVQESEILLKVLPGEPLILEEKWDVFAAEDTVLDKGVSLLDCDHLGHHVAKPAGVDEVEFVEVVVAIVVVEKCPHVCQKECGSFKLVVVLYVKQTHLLDHCLKLLRVHDGLVVSATNLHLD